VQCPRCASVVADTVTVCPKCGNPLSTLVDSYGATSFAPVMPAPQPVAQVTVRQGTAQMDNLSTAATMMVPSQPMPPTMVSGSAPPHSPPGASGTPHYVVTPAPSPAPYQATMQSAAPMAPPPAMSSPYAPPPAPLAYPPSYPMPMKPVSQQGTPGLAVAALVCGLLGWVPFWIGFILCLLAITFGGIVLGQTRPGQQGRGLAITGLIFGLVLLLPAACGL
jgi:hypothetical protein